MLSSLNPVSVLILAAGVSKRMNYPKPLLKFDNNKLFIDKIVDVYNYFGCNEIIIVTNNDLAQKIKVKCNVKFVVNDNLDFGRFYSVKLGLKYLSENEYCFIQNTDNPFVDTDTLKLLYSNKNVGDCIIPEYNGQGGHPVLFGMKIIDSIISANENDLNLKDFLRNYDCKRIATDDEKIIININTPDDYRKYFS